MTADLRAHWPVVADALRSARRVLLVLDFDGTLVPLRSHPALVRAPRALRWTLRRCRRLPGCRIAVVSGRALDDVRRRLGVSGLMVAGNHGLEIAGPWGRWTHHAARARRVLMRAVARQLAQSLRHVPGVLIEDKGLTLSVHVRRVAVRRRAWARRLTRDALRAWVRQGHVRMTDGKHVLEVRPPVAWGKGHAVDWIRRRLAWTGPRTLTVILGDDRTDEEAFRRHPSALTVVVGSSRRRSRARFRLRTPADVLRFLRTLSALRAAHA